MTVGVAADPLFWAFYRSGVIDRCPGEINHAVVLAGVKADPFDNYWIVKNSWGTAWGENGFIKIDRSQNNGNTCQICTYPAYSNAV
jgi:aminopeptidase C